jgi:hypothetical protein
VSGSVKPLLFWLTGLLLITMGAVLYLQEALPRHVPIPGIIFRPRAGNSFLQFLSVLMVISGVLLAGFAFSKAVGLYAPALGKIIWYCFLALLVVCLGLMLFAGTKS